MNNFKMLRKTFFLLDKSKHYKNLIIRLSFKDNTKVKKYFLENKIIILNKLRQNLNATCRLLTLELEFFFLCIIAISILTLNFLFYKQKLFKIQLSFD